MLSLIPTQVELILDLEALSLAKDKSRSFSKLFPAVVQAVLIAREYQFRNIILCGSSVPESVRKKYDWNSIRSARVELEIWRELVGEPTMPLVGFSDYAITYPMEQDSGRPVNPPSRIRLSTSKEHVFWRAPREDYLDLCAKVFSSSDFDPDLEAWGADIISQCALSGRYKGGPTEWLARDTNYHVELTLKELETILRGDPRFEQLKFSTEEKFAWGTTGNLVEIE